ncbi:MAG: FkbM family methyltransferase [Candidatus Pacebacteria bacterium]|nr:FkbM family methyltransferase [Candidatus Paceibacterota bacterium]
MNYSKEKIYLFAYSRETLVRKFPVLAKRLKRYFNDDDFITWFKIRKFIKKYKLCAEFPDIAKQLSRQFNLFDNLRFILANCFVGVAGFYADKLDTFYLRKRLGNIERIDFKDKDIYISVDSVQENNLRLHSCSKEPFTVEWIKKTAHKGVFYDIGANVGAYSLIAASLMGDSGSVVSFEPAYFNFYKLNENIRINKLNEKIIALNLALTDKNSLLNFSFSNIESGSAQDSKNEVIYRTFVAAMTLDNAIDYYHLPFPEHIKIDIDNGELELLVGGQETFANSEIKTVMIEIDESEGSLKAAKVYEYFLSLGFKLNEKFRLPLSKVARFNILFTK